MTSFPIELFSQEFSHLLKTCFFSSITKEIHLQIYIIKNMKGTQEFRLVLMLFYVKKKKSVISRIFHQPRPVPDRMKMQVSVMSEPTFFSFSQSFLRNPEFLRDPRLPGDPFSLPELYFVVPGISKCFRFTSLFLCHLNMHTFHILFLLGCILFWK